MSEAKIFIPLDFRKLKAGHEPFILAVDEEEEPKCARLDLFTESVHVQVKIDEVVLRDMSDRFLAALIEITKARAFEKGAAHALRSKKRGKE